MTTLGQLLYERLRLGPLAWAELDAVTRARYAQAAADIEREVIRRLAVNQEIARQKAERDW